jgi:hypothetical protein
MELIGLTRIPKSTDDTDKEKGDFMKSFAKQLGIIFLMIVTYQTANAGLLLEPYLGYVSGQEKQVASVNFTGTEMGARVGFTKLGFAIGADYTIGSFTDDASPKDKFTVGDLGVFIAYKFPVLIRAYATYVPSAKLKIDTTPETTLQKGTAMKLGVGFTGLPFVVINLEYITSTYDEAEQGGVTGSLNPSATTTAYALTVSAPFDLF